MEKIPIQYLSAAILIVNIIQWVTTLIIFLLK